MVIPFFSGARETNHAQRTLLYALFRKWKMVWAWGKNGRVPYGQKGVDGRSQWGTGTIETEVKLDGWCEGGLRQQRNGGGGCATIRERSERVESPGTYVTE